MFLRLWALFLYRDFLPVLEGKDYLVVIKRDPSEESADVTNYYTDDLGCFRYTLRHLEMPQTDENRTYMTLDVEFTKRTTYTNFRRDFDLFYFNSRGVVLYKSAFYTGAGGKIEKRFFVMNKRSDRQQLVRPFIYYNSLY